MVLSFLGFKLYVMFLDVLFVCNIAFEISSDFLETNLAYKVHSNFHCGWRKYCAAWCSL